MTKSEHMLQPFFTWNLVVILA